MIGSKIGNQHFYTFLGSLAIIFWSALALFATIVHNLPTFEILSLAFLISFSLTITKLTVYHDWHKIKQPIALWIYTTIGVLGNEAFFITAIKFAPAEQVTIIFYTWPIWVFIISYLLLKEKLAIRYLNACIIGLLGLYIALVEKNFLFLFNINYIKGYILAFLSASVWSVYIIASRYFEKSSYELVGMCFGLCATISAILHFCFENTVIPTQPQFVAIIIMGLTTEGLAYIFWDRGIKKGNYHFLYLLAYCNPIFAVGLLILFDRAPLRLSFIFGVMLLVLSNMMVKNNLFLRWPWRRRSSVLNTTRSHLEL